MIYRKTIYLHKGFVGKFLLYFENILIVIFNIEISKIKNKKYKSQYDVIINEKRCKNFYIQGYENYKEQLIKCINYNVGNIEEFDFNEICKNLSNNIFTLRFSKNLFRW